MFKRKKKQEDDVLVDIISFLADMEPKKVNRLFQLVKKARKTRNEIKSFVEGRPDEVDQITKEMEKENEKSKL